MRCIPIFVLLLATSLTAQTVTYYGTGSPYVGKSLTVVGTPKLGATIEIKTDQNLQGWSGGLGHGNSTGTLLFGIDRIQARVPICHPSGLTFLTTPLLTKQMGIKSTTYGRWIYHTSFKVTIPNNTVFLGSKTMVQWYYRSYSTIYNCWSCGGSSCSVSRAAEILVGR